MSVQQIVLAHWRGTINEVAVHQYRWNPNIVGERAASTKVLGAIEAPTPMGFDSPGFEGMRDTQLCRPFAIHRFLRTDGDVVVSLGNAGTQFVSLVPL